MHIAKYLENTLYIVSLQGIYSNLVNWIIYLFLCTTRLRIMAIYFSYLTEKFAKKKQSQAILADNNVKSNMIQNENSIIWLLNCNS